MANRLAPVPGLLVYSDDPETAEAVGILYTSSLESQDGPAVFYFYHVNGMTGRNAHFAMIAENLGSEAATVTVRRRALTGPSANYLFVGREASREFVLAPEEIGAFEVGPGESVSLDPILDSLTVAPNQLINAIYEYETTGPIEVSSVMVEQGVDAGAAFPGLTKAPDDGNNREGTFNAQVLQPPAGFYSFSTSQHSRRIRISDGIAPGALDPPLVGVDEDGDNPSATLRGNYGVLYRIPLDLTAADRRGVAILLNPRGGNYGGYVNVVVDGENRGAMIPSGSLVVPPTTSAGVVALFPPGQVPQRATLELTPAGASSLPIDLLIVAFGEPAPPQTWVAF